jgi:hypothetical protein
MPFSFIGRYRYKKYTTATKSSGNLRSGRESNLVLHDCVYQASMLQDSLIAGGGGGGGEDDYDVHNNNNNNNNNSNNNIAGAERDTLDIMA